MPPSRPARRSRISVSSPGPLLGDGHRQHPQDAAGGADPRKARGPGRAAPPAPGRRRHRAHEPGGADVLRRRLRARATAERLVPRIAELVQSGLSREAFLEAAAKHARLLRPRDPRSPGRSGGELGKVVIQQPMSRREISPAFEVPHTTILTPRTELADKLLIEISRGCTEMCRFCWAAYAMAPIKQYPAASILKVAREARPLDRPDRADRDRGLRPSGDHRDPRRALGARLPHRALVDQDRRDRGADPRSPRPPGRARARRSLRRPATSA